MRHIIALVLCVFLLATTVSAAGVVTDLQSSTNVAADGSCRVNLTVQLRVDSREEDLTFPIPGDAKDVSLNGRSVRTKRQGDLRHIELEDIVGGAGVYTLSIQYSLPDSVISPKKNQLLLEFDILSGFAYPIEKLQFTVNLPGAPEKEPAFFSTYYQETADTILAVTVAENVITGVTNRPLQDRESLRLSLEVTEDLFPQSMAKQWKMGTDDILMIAVAALALVYWLLTMRSLPPRRGRRPVAPEGLTAGELGCCLTGQGVDLSMMVVSWAQMGYLHIQLDKNHRVFLQKRMAMGNERSDFEVRFFKHLFGAKTTIEATGSRYARLCQKAGKHTPNLRDYYQRHSGNPYIFRGLCAIIGLLGGISLGTSFANDTLWQVILSVVLGGACLVLSWIIQAGAGEIHLRKKKRLLIGLIGSGIWMVLGALSGEWNVALAVIPAQWVCGLAWAYGGRRSEIGRQYMAQILGLRRHFRKATETELQRIVQTNPDYYYATAPYALALGADKAFARQWGNLQLGECAYLTGPKSEKLTVGEFMTLLRSTVKAMDAGQGNTWLNKFTRR
ncbi:MAG: DUF2207 domain-containing protein [Ruminococcaceae bacterium]|nr:DUF2207 domain-containing protein [Oscillospiraceae bacterium]